MDQAAVAGIQIPVNELIAPVRFPTPEQVRVLRQSYAMLEPAGDLVATLFFRRLDKIAPETRAMLPAGEQEQHQQLWSSLALAIASLDRFDDIIPALKLLGLRFRALGVNEIHYGAVGEALLWTLDCSLGHKCTPDVFDAWTAFCAEIAEIMTAAR